MSILNIAVWQDEGVPGSIVDNLNTIRNQAMQAANDGVDVLVFPECFLTGYYINNVAAVAAGVDQSIKQQLTEIAASNSITLVLGTAVLDNLQPQLVRNEAWFITPANGIEHIYQKRMLFGDWEKNNFAAAPKDQFCVFDYGGFRIGLLICFDVEYPELVREAALQGVNVVLVPTSLMQEVTDAVDNSLVSTQMVPSRAQENQIYVLYANRCGRESLSADDYLDYEGLSCIIDPAGRTLDRGTETAQRIHAVIDTKVIEAVRNEFNYIDEFYPN